MRTIRFLMAGLAVAPFLAPAARAEDGEALPPPPPARVTAPEEPPGATVRSEGTVRGLVPVPQAYSSPCAPPCPQERDYCVERTLESVPEYLSPVYAPAGSFRIPWTGEYTPRQRAWTVFGGESVTYDTNIFLADEDRDQEEDFIFHTNAGVSVRQEGAAFHFLGSVVGTYDWYLDHDDENFVNVFAMLDAGWRGVSAYVSVSDRFTYGQDPIVVRDDKFVIVGQDLDEYFMNIFSGRVGWECVKWRAEAEYENVWFDGTGVIDAFDHLDHAGHGRLDYYLTPKVSVGAKGGARFVDYQDDTQEDFWVYDGQFVFSFRPTAKLGIRGGVGAAFLQNDEEETSWVADVGASLQATSKVLLEVEYRHTFEPSLGATAQIVDLIAGRADVSLAPNWSIDANAGVQIGDTLNPTADGARDYLIYFAGAAIHHTFNCWLSGDLSYLFRRQDADDTGIDYQVHRVTLGFTVTL